MSDVIVNEAPYQTSTLVKPHTPMVFSNAKLVLPETVINGTLAVDRGKICDLSKGGARNALDCEGDYLLPGLVELHTDHLESHYKPRPGVTWNAVSAVQAHDAQIACSGITTVFDALRVGMEDDADLTARDMREMADAIEIGQREGRLRADHFIHLRCEVSADNCVDGFDLFKDDPRVRLASLMDHTPGQRQFTSLDQFELYYKTQKGFSDQQMKEFTEQMQTRAKRNSNKNRLAIAERAKAAGMMLASHDDATLAHVKEATHFGINVAEFPTTLEAAKASHEAGMAVLMGAPNVVRGKSHSGNISARELAEAGYLDVLSSDYVPVSLLQAAFRLEQQIESISLPEAVQKVTRIPAQAVGLSDRGALEEGRRADLIQVRMVGDVPIVRGVWREGYRVA
ncbi:Alpha-D-ribose 1-methylphosphonate 5-triphosphate diphosphatase [Pseudovibrio axinellae]|uniref:Alpha-D-ribose 1-methylphosphonate 5-triphosphate diphosphatase n=1 Tax=Pseudovibrio axinellae TaxID=989403 RepID=A0A166A7B9_9HYPH|nr:alpha-D-ribose 1-methylphosphonate 5-triphosphate diphosphatase [Pseudovibrio axinellae]KZL20693.1 Alpha-D-ribose 1-methylphosphonate 5-triphosphate diphosphatase [Pseudovibrio axinellae]SER25505.1 alpha-D-ribose 1-methylphosphonate 5-triphosphate diphosphatase [Pseudovibrio axinellae]